MPSAVVFAYHNVGVRCLSALLALGFEIRLVVTHTDRSGEAIWFGSVARLAADTGIPTIAPDDPNATDVIERVAACAPDFLFSFYYRQILQEPLLRIPLRGAYNLHGSMLPKYRGRAPINWAVILGETETGATLHVMNEKPDNGPIVDQMTVPILPDDTARDVFDKVVVAAELVTLRAVPALVDGRMRLTPQDLSQGAYFGGRTAQDGVIDWRRPAAAIHNLVRGVTRPYPGAFSHTKLGKLAVWQTRHTGEAMPGAPALLERGGDLLLARCGDGRLLRVIEAELDGQALDAQRLGAKLGGYIALV